jgi:TPR repeat protein
MGNFGTASGAGSFLNEESATMVRFKRNLHLTAAATALSLVLAPHSLAAENLEVALAPSQEKRHTIRLESLQARARKGEAQAQLRLSGMYRSGKGVEQDEYQAFYWCKLAAEGGLLDAQYQLGLHYLQGIGVSENEERALEWIWLASDRGNQQAVKTLQFILQNDFTTGC